MNKEILIELYRLKDRKRKMLLNELYYKQIHLKLSQTFIANMINRDLGVENLIQADDIRYCKFYFKHEKEASKQDVKNDKDLIKPVQSSHRQAEKPENSSDDLEVDDETPFKPFNYNFKYKQK